MARPPQFEDSAVITVQAERELFDRYNTLAKARKTTRTQLIRQALEYYANRLEGSDKRKEAA